MDKITQLSVAIRLGSIGATQGIGMVSFHSETSPCVLGMAKLSIMMDPKSSYYDLEQRFPILGLKKVKSPAYSSISSSLLYTIWELNDVYRWPPADIADWLERIEKEQEKQEK
mgnify:FL=1